MENKNSRYVASIALPTIICLSVSDIVGVQDVPFEYPISVSLSLTLGCVSVLPMVSYTVPAFRSWRAHEIGKATNVRNALRRSSIYCRGKKGESRRTQR
jgi:hypothetical protein